MNEPLAVREAPAGYRVMLDAQHVRPGYKQTEVGLIPEDWDALPLSAITSEIGDGLHGTPTYSSNGTYFFINGNNLRDGKLVVTEETKTVDQSEFAKNRKNLGDRSILMSINGTIGNLGLFDGEAVVLGKSAAYLNVKNGVSKLFVYHSLQAEIVRGQFLDGLTGSTIGNLGLATIRNTRVPLPPTLEEQRAIAAALSDVDALLAKHDQLIAKKRDLKQAAMQQLLTGSTRLPGFGGEWEVKRLGDVVDTDPENLGSDTLPDFVFNYIALEDVDHGFLRSYAEQVFALAPSRARRRLREKDVLVSTVRPNLRSHLLFVGDTRTWVCSTGFCVVRCRQGVMNPAYVFSHFFGSYLNRQIDALLTGSNYPAINSGDVRALQIPVPEYAEQTAIAAVLSDMDTEIAALEARRAKTRDLKQGMMQELLTGRIRLV